MKLTESTLGQFPILELQDPSSGAFVSALPTRGGTVHRLGLPDPEGRIREVMMPMRTEREMERHRWSKGAMLAPWPNRIREARYEFDGKVHQPVKNFKPQGGHAIHGTVCFETFRLASRRPADPSFELTLDSKGWAGYPFPRASFLSLPIGRWRIGSDLFPGKSRQDQDPRRAWVASVFSTLRQCEALPAGAARR
jgi:galactose mutarotase-like enzyme